jgi:hypothetical protein
MLILGVYRSCISILYGCDFNTVIPRHLVQQVALPVLLKADQTFRYLHIIITLTSLHWFVGSGLYLGELTCGDCALAVLMLDAEIISRVVSIRSLVGSGSKSLPQHVLSPQCSIELLGFSRLDRHEPFMLLTRKKSPSMGMANITFAS